MAEAASQTGSVEIHVVEKPVAVTDPQAGNPASTPDSSIPLIQDPAIERQWLADIDQEIKTWPGEMPSESKMGLSISLVHNTSGQILWHGQQEFTIKVKDDPSIEKLIEHFFSALPKAPPVTAVPAS